MIQTKNARFLLVGDGLSTFGSWIDFLAILTLAAYTYRATPYQMALISITGLLPGILAAQYIGRLCDRRNPKTLLLLSLLMRVAATAAILLTSNFYIFLVMVGFRSVFSSFLVPAINVMAVRSVPTDARTDFYSTLNIINSIAKIAAPMIGTISSSLGSESIALLSSAVLTVASFAAFVPIQWPKITSEQPDVAAKEAGAPQAAPSLAPLLYLGSVYALYAHMINNLIPLVLERASFDKALLGVLVGSAGGGNIASGLWLRRKRSNTPPTYGSIIRPSLVQAAGFVLIGQLINLQPAFTTYLLPALFFCIGIFATRHTVTLSLFCSQVYGAVMGRATAMLQSSQNAMLLLGPLAGAYVLERWGSAWLFGVSAAVAVVGYSLVPLLWMAREEPKSAAW